MNEKTWGEQKRDEVGTKASESMLGPNPVVGVRGQDLFMTTLKLIKRSITQPQLVLQQNFKLSQEAFRILTGASSLEPAGNDRRFNDPTWKENGLYHRVLQLYLLLDKDLHDWVERIETEPDDKAREHFVLSLLTDALAPSNSPLNPTALKRLLETGGRSAVNGVRHFIDDFRHNQGMPSQVDKTAFKVGQNLATTPGQVVFRNEVLELIQYQPITQTVSERPLLIVPPQINKFYVFDLSPQKSLVKYALDNGLQVFVVSWRNPTPAERDWGLDRYVEAIKQAIEVACEITDQQNCNLMGACSGGITTVALLGHLAACNEPKVNALTLMVSVFDTGSDKTTLGLFATEEAIEAARRHSHERGVLEGEELGRVFAWLRPNDLIWNYWVNNYLIGNAPPAFDVLYWNCDTTRLPAAFHSELLTLYKENLLVKAGQFSVCGTPIDLGQVTCDFYAVAGTTDHITPWDACYRSSRLLGGKSKFVLSNSGHIQSILNPPGNPKASFFTNPHYPAEATAWYEGATKHKGSWWEDWKVWILERSGSQKAAPQTLGSRKYSPIAKAPGTYVYE